MKKLLAVAALVILVVLGGTAYGSVKYRPKCNPECQKLNDRWFLPSEYDDYFVNDSDGKKDLVFSVYRNVRVGDFVCSVIKSDNYSISAVCPGAVASQGYAPPDDE